MKTARTQIIRVPARTAPNIIRVSAPRASHKKHHRRRKGGAVGSLTSQRMLEFAIGGAAFGFISKQFGDKLPTLPVIGRSGTIAIGAYYFGKSKGGLVRDIAIAAAVIAGFEIGTTGKISGDDGFPQVHGVASQV